MPVTEELQKKIDIAIARFRSFEPEDGYFLAFSGGKDSQTIYHLAKLAGVKFDAHYSVTTVDPPELVHFIKDNYPDVQFDVARDKDGRQITMWNLIEKRMVPPTRLMRYCCEVLKEVHGDRRVTVTGVRWAESPRRRDSQDLVSIKGKPKKTQLLADQAGLDYRINKAGALILNDDNDGSRRLVEQCYRTRKTILNPVVDWTDNDVWTFLNKVVCVPHCVLYDRGHTRLGCIGCPMSSSAREQLDEYPKYKAAYLRTFARMLEARKQAGKETDWQTPEDVMEWWLSGGKVNNKER